MSVSSTQTMYRVDKLYIMDPAWPVFSQEDTTPPL